MFYWFKNNKWKIQSYSWWSFMTEGNATAGFLSYILDPLLCIFKYNTYYRTVWAQWKQSLFPDGWEWCKSNQQLVDKVLVAIVLFTEADVLWDLAAAASLPVDRACWSHRSVHGLRGGLQTLLSQYYPSAQQSHPIRYQRAQHSAGNQHDCC